MTIRLTSAQAEADVVSSAEREAEVISSDYEAFETQSVESPKSQVACFLVRSQHVSTMSHVDSAVKGDAAKPDVVAAPFVRQRPMGSGLTIPPK